MSTRNLVVESLLTRIARREDPWQAEKELKELGPEGIAGLVDIRRGGPGVLRRPALRALAVLGAGAALAERDRRALERLVRIKLPDDRPLDHLCPFVWIAVPAAAYEGVFEALGLHDPVPATMALGMSAVEHDTAVVTGPDGGERTVLRAFVTPEFAGWRMVFGGPVDTCAEEEVLARVSAHCGQAHYYFRDGYDDAHAWAIAEGGRVLRSFQTYREPAWTGEPMPWETPWTEDEDAEPGLYEPNASLESNANEVADALTVDPERIDEDTPMSGHGWLAFTAPGVGNPPFPGVLDI
ncbi:hypothetical protein GCM10010302_29800 [Streptomyces polychromogenes]|uniref:Uncharacterized protein n=1 Tax=Streptomyces polychromogenes TaxID=67342 RepID=A0ABN0VDT5_9ACTN